MASILKDLGIKVLEMGHVVAVPSSAAVLADWGAEVLKIEPLTGDMARGIGRSLGVGVMLESPGGNVNWRFEFHNRGKRSLALDLRNESGRQIINQLVKEYDVFMSNYEVNVLKKFELDYAHLSQLNPRLVHAVLTGYGTKGPDKDERGFDYVAAWARSGIQYLLGEPGTTPPPQRGGMMDRNAALHMVAGIMAALLHREKTGEGQELEFSLYNTGVWTLGADIQAHLVDQPMPKLHRTEVPQPLTNVYHTKDDRWLQVFMTQSDVFWPDFCRALGKTELENDPRFNSRDAREENCVELIRILDETFATKTMAEWEKSLRENNCICGRVQTPAETVNDPQALANDFFVEIEHPIAGKLKLVNTPVKFRQNPASVQGPAPELAQHTEEVLLEIGYSWEDIARLKDEGTIL